MRCQSRRQSESLEDDLLIDDPVRRRDGGRGSITVSTLAKPRNHRSRAASRTAWASLTTGCFDTLEVAIALARTDLDRGEPTLVAFAPMEYLVDGFAIRELIWRYERLCRGVDGARDSFP